MSVTFLTNEDEKKYVKSVNGAVPDADGNVEVDIPSDEHINDLIDAKVHSSGGNVDLTIDGETLVIAENSTATIEDETLIL